MNFRRNPGIYAIIIHIYYFHADIRRMDPVTRHTPESEEEPYEKEMKSLKPLTAVFCAAALTLGLAACSGGNTSADTGSASDTESASSAGQEAAGSGSASGRTDLNLCIGDAFSTVDPHNLSLNSDIMLSRQIYEPLYWINDEGEEIPMLATEYSISEDGLTWTFQLREGVTFQNGDP